MNILIPTHPVYQTARGWAMKRSCVSAFSPQPNSGTEHAGVKMKVKMNKPTIHHSRLDEFSRHIQPRNIKMFEKNQDGVRKLLKTDVIQHAILSMNMREAHKSSQLAEEKAIMEEFYGNDSLGG
jgi:hypothetical protein